MHPKQKVEMIQTHQKAERLRSYGQPTAGACEPCRREAALLPLTGRRNKSHLQKFSQVTENSKIIREQLIVTGLSDFWPSIALGTMYGLGKRGTEVVAASTCSLSVTSR